MSYITRGAAAMKTFVICIHEDRAEYLMGVQLAVASLAQHSPDIPIFVSCPNAGSEFLSWLGRQSNASPIELPNTIGKGWNIKPSVLLQMLRQFDDVLWIDSDIIVSGDIRKHFRECDDTVLVAAQETFWGQRQGGTFRTAAWGLEPGRQLETTVNSGILRVTRRHQRLLEAWQLMLSNPAYLKAQSQPWYERPLHMIGDQEVLTGLLGSVDFQELPIRLLRRGADIAQCFGPAGFTPVERIRSIVGHSPAFVHAMGPKPWLRQSSAPPALKLSIESMRNWYQFLSLEVSPYSAIASRYTREDFGIEWAKPRSHIGKLLWWLGFGKFELVGFPVAVFDHLARRFRRLLGVARYSCSADFMLKDRPF